ncbi:MAG: PQQ-binding-like beta-propeller repeat protein [Armatimonadetes bacterium]|nr:PQQ-binding-like beta-propeller repeat protein [Armatimonadota bacterium]
MPLQNTPHWPQFRGPNAAGISASSKLPTRWSATENIAWRTALTGKSWSSPIVWGDKIFVTAVVRPGEGEKPKKGLYFGGERLELPKDEHSFNVLCLSLTTGKMLWQKTVFHGPPTTTVHLKNSYGAETPVTDGERVYALFGGLGLFTLDTKSGKELWSKKLEPRKTRFGWGYAASPVLHQGKLFLLNDNDEKAELLAFDAKTGKPLWHVERDEKSNWATPFAWQSGGRTELVVPGTRAVRSYDPQDGKLLWSLKGMSSITIPTPTTGEGLLFVSSGYVGDQLRPLYAIRPGASGDITGSATAIAWSNPTAGPYNPSPLFYEGRIYVLYDRGLFSAFEAKTGKQLYDRERLPIGSGFTASPWAANGKIYCLSEDGICYVLKAGDKFELLQANRLTDDDMCMATPALAGERLLIRTANTLYCVKNN